MLDGGAGADYLEGGAGDDTYLDVSGEDTLFDTEGNNTLILAAATGVGANGLSVANTGDQGQNRQLNIALDNGDTLKLDDAFFGTHATIQFANGDALDLETLVGATLVMPLNLQNDDNGGKVYGGAGNDVLKGGAGNDWFWRVNQTRIDFAGQHSTPMTLVVLTSKQAKLRSFCVQQKLDEATERMQNDKPKPSDEMHNGSPATFPLYGGSGEEWRLAA